MFLADIKNQLTRISPQKKLIEVNQKLGNSGIKNMQGTTRIIYDTLPCDNISNFRFFESSNSRLFPFTNLTNSGNQLQVGETMVINKITFTILGKSSVTALWESYFNLQEDSGDGQFSVKIANQEVIKPIPMTSLLYPNARWINPAGSITGMWFDTQVVIPPLVDFVVDLRLNSVYTPIVDRLQYIRCTLHGVGSIINTKATF